MVYRKTLGTSVFTIDAYTKSVLFSFYYRRGIRFLLDQPTHRITGSFCRFLEFIKLTFYILRLLVS